MNIVLSCKSVTKCQKNWQNVKQSSKPHIGDIWDLWVNMQIKNLRAVSKEVLYSFNGLFLLLMQKD